MGWLKSYQIPLILAAPLEFKMPALPIISSFYVKRTNFWYLAEKLGCWVCHEEGGKSNSAIKKPNNLQLREQGDGVSMLRKVRMQHMNPKNWKAFLQSFSRASSWGESCWRAKKVLEFSIGRAASKSCFYLFAIWTLTNCLTSLHLSFLTCTCELTPVGFLQSFIFLKKTFVSLVTDMAHYMVVFSKLQPKHRFKDLFPLPPP